MTYSVMKISFHIKMGRLNIKAGESVLDEYLAVCLNCGFTVRLSQPRQWGDALGFWSRGWFPLEIREVVTLIYWRSL